MLVDRQVRDVVAPEPGSDTRDAAALILPGAIGIGLGVFLGTLLSDSLAVVVAVALLGAALGHAAGYLALRGSSDRFP